VLALVDQVLVDVVGEGDQVVLRQSSAIIVSSAG
jgi:hypothetical protein